MTKLEKMSICCFFSPSRRRQDIDRSQVEWLLPFWRRSFRPARQSPEKQCFFCGKDNLISLSLRDCHFLTPYGARYIHIPLTIPAPFQKKKIVSHSKAHLLFLPSENEAERSFLKSLIRPITSLLNLVPTPFFVISRTGLLLQINGWCHDYEIRWFI